jgi:hypothetical protein
MSSVLTGQSKHSGEPLRSNVLQPNQADACNRVALVKLWAKRRRQVTFHYSRLGAKVHQQSSRYDAMDSWQLQILSG